MPHVARSRRRHNTLHTLPCAILSCYFENCFLTSFSHLRTRKLQKPATAESFIALFIEPRVSVRYERVRAYRAYP